MRIIITGLDSSSDTELELRKAFGDNKGAISIIPDGGDQVTVYVDLNELLTAIKAVQALA